MTQSHVFPLPLSLSLLCLSRSDTLVATCRIPAQRSPHGIQHRILPRLVHHRLLDRAVSAAEATFGRIDVLVNNAIEAYAATAGARRAQISGYSGKQAGDPARAAQAIIRVAESPNPPMNLVLGKDGLKRVREKLDKFTDSLRQWESTTVGADFPET
jgi:hypothetical protein